MDGCPDALQTMGRRHLRVAAPEDPMRDSMCRPAQCSCVALEYDNVVVHILGSISWHSVIYLLGLRPL